MEGSQSIWRKINFLYIGYFSGVIRKNGIKLFHALFPVFTVQKICIPLFNVGINLDSFTDTLFFIFPVEGIPLFIATQAFKNILIPYRTINIHSSKKFT